jgi:hypothetical protein
MRKFLIGLFQILSVALLALDWFYIPLAVALIPCYLIRRFLFPLPYWVFFVSGGVSLLVNWLLYPFATGIILLPVSMIWDWLHPSGKAPVREDTVSPPSPAASSRTPEKLP